MKSNPIAFFLALLLMSACHAGTDPQGTKNQPQAQSSPTWVRYTDNAEGAFSMEVPVGWQVEGGMYRFGYFDVRWMMDVRSLDGKVIIRIDDPNVPPYVLPGPHSGPAGHPAIRPKMYQMVVDDYREAQPYAESYAKRRFGPVCTSFNAKSADWTPTMPEDWQKADGVVKSTQASVAYECATSDGPRIVNVFARDTVIGNQGLWLVDPIISILATPDRMPLARSMTQHMIDSWQKNPEWQQHQDEITRMGLAQMQAEFGRFMQQMAAYHQQREAAMNQQVAKFEARQQAQADQVSSWGNILTGLTNLYDPVTGTQFQVFSGPKANYYSNGAGVKINSNLDPGNGFHLDQNLGP
ncbi:MAG TPA: hypothetical protein VFO39_22080 [Candidatus Sulfotelmatobacter sp.]|nr:hypothetical protein [Candidatus Sulfotelmatobacter sp.]